MKKLLSAILALCMALSLCTTALAAQNSMDNFTKVNTYSGQFKDVSASHWAAPSVRACYEYNLMNGSGGKFNLNGNLTVAEALVMADRIHQIYATGANTLKNGSPWYQPYVDYAIENGLIAEGDFSDYNAPITRADMAYIFANALPLSELPARNDIDSLPDVKVGDKHATEIFLLYRAGVLTGSGALGTFYPNNTITRAEAAAILSRIALPEERRTFQLYQQWTHGKITLTMPGDMQVVENTSANFSLQGSTALIVGQLKQDSDFSGLSIFLLTEQEMIDTVIKGFNGVLSNAAAEKVTFGSIDAYRITADYNDGNSAFAMVIYAYIDQDILYLVGLGSQDGDALEIMTDNFRFSGYTAALVK